MLREILAGDAVLVGHHEIVEQQDGVQVYGIFKRTKMKTNLSLQNLQLLSDEVHLLERSKSFPSLFDRYDLPPSSVSPVSEHSRQPSHRKQD